MAYGGNLSLFDKNGYKAIHLACQQSNLAIVKYIIEEYGGNKSVMLNQPTKNKFGETCLMVAVRHADIACIQLLCDCEKVNLLNVRDKEKRYNSLEYAAYYGNGEVLLLLSIYIIIHLDWLTLNCKSTCC